MSIDRSASTATMNAGATMRLVTFGQPGYDNQ